MEAGTFIAKGNTAEIYKTDQHIIKLFNKGVSEDYVLYEAHKQRSVHAERLPVPEVFDVRVVNGQQAIIMEHIEGTTIGDLYLNDTHNAKKYIELSIDVQLAIHNVTMSTITLEKMSDKLTRQLKAAPHLTSEQIELLVERLHAMNVESRLCHGDFHLYNLIQGEKGVSIIDWVDASIGDIRADVYRTYLLYMPHSIDFAEMYLDLYCAKSGVQKEEIFQWAPIIAAARLSEHVPSENASRLLSIVEQYI